MKSTLFALMPILLAAPGAPPRIYAPEDVPPELAGAVRRADAAAQTLQRKLSGRLVEAMKQGGAVNALHVCRDEARQLTEEAARDTGVAVGRTSDRLRNPLNTPPPWAAPQVAAAAGKRSSEVGPAVYDLGDKVGVLRPISVAQPCTRCHGGPDAIPPEISRSLQRLYPSDRATGYSEGDHRGFVWAVAPR